jgi:hypothetical protein
MVKMEAYPRWGGGLPFFNHSPTCYRTGPVKKPEAREGHLDRSPPDSSMDKMPTGVAGGDIGNPMNLLKVRGKIKLRSIRDSCKSSER